jgi:hypothetical protein
MVEVGGILQGGNQLLIDFFGSTKPTGSSGSGVSSGSGMRGLLTSSNLKSATPKCSAHTCCALSERIFHAQHDQVVNVPIALTGTETMEPDLIILVDIHHETVLGIDVERAQGAVPIFPDARETIPSSVSAKWIMASMVAADFMS